MPLYAFNSDVEVTSIYNLVNRDQVVIGTNGYVYGQDTLFQGTANNRFVIAGTLASYAIPIVIGSPGTLGLNARINVTETGVISGYHAIAFYGAGLDLVNEGLIEGSEAAIRLENFGAAALKSRIINTGTIFGDDYGILGTDDTIDALTVENSGLIAARSVNKAIFLSDNAVANDVLINSGMIRGSVALGGGNDLYDGRGGGTVDGLIGGGAGNDTFRPGSAEERFDGGLGADTLDFRGDLAVTIALDNSFEAEGMALGDTWVGIEHVIGSIRADRISGDGTANRLVGGGGIDTLAGGAGSDVLEGGAGKDILAGGTGSDRFTLRDLAGAGDLVSDFSSSGVNGDDSIGISTALGGGLSAGALAATQFQLRADNVAQDANDRFVFRTTDQTLWFDADGNGSAAAVMLFDLQAGATMTAADIIIF